MRADTSAPLASAPPASQGSREHSEVAVADSIMQRINHRKTPRASWIAYNEGMYFVTVCTKNKKHHFGWIANGEMHLTEIGKILNSELANPKAHHPHITIPLFVVMPNHFHAIIIVGTPVNINHRNLPEVANDRYLPQYIEASQHVPARGRNNPLLSTYIGSLKSAVTKIARKIVSDFAWQQRYHDHMITNNYECNQIAEYITNNVVRWDLDRYNS